MLAKATFTVSETTINKLNWQEKSNKLREKYPNLSDWELNFEEGNVEELINRLHSKIGDTIGKTKEGLHKFIEAL